MLMMSLLASSAVVNIVVSWSVAGEGDGGEDRRERREEMARTCGEYEEMSELEV